MLQWGSEELTKRAEDCILDRAALTEGLAQLRIVVENLGMPPRLHQFHYCINGDHPEMPGAEVVFCEYADEPNRTLVSGPRDSPCVAPVGMVLTSTVLPLQSPTPTRFLRIRECRTEPLPCEG